MGRASFSPQDTVRSSLGFGEGRAEVVAACIGVQKMSPNKKTGQTYAPRCAVKLTLKRLDANWEPTDAEEIDEYVSIGDLAKFHPGKADGPNDADPVSLADENGDIDDELEGNAIFCVDEAKIDKKSKISILGESLVKYGFKHELLNGFAPNLVGLKAKFVQADMEKGADYTGAKDPKALAVSEIRQLPYDKKGKAAGAAPAAKGEAKKAVQKTADDGDDADAQAESFAGKMLAKMGSVFANETITRKKINTRVSTLNSSMSVPAAVQKAVEGLFKDDDWFTKQAKKRGWAVDDDGDVTFPSEDAAAAAA